MCRKRFIGGEVKFKEDYKKRTPTIEYLSKGYVIGDKCYSHGKCFEPKK